MDRAPGLSVRLKLTLSYAGFLMVAGVLLLAAAWLAGQNRRSFEFLDGAISATGGLVPGNSNFLLRTIAPAAVIVLVFLLVFGLLGGWLLAGRMLAPLTRITNATRTAGCHRTVGWVGYVTQQEHPHDCEQQGAGNHEEAGVAEGEFDANAQAGRSIHRRLPGLRCLACRCGSRRRVRWR